MKNYTNRDSYTFLKLKNKWFFLIGLVSTPNPLQKKLILEYTNHDEISFGYFKKSGNLSLPFKFWVTTISISRDTTSQIFHFHEGKCHRDTAFTPWNSPKF